MRGLVVRHWTGLSDFDRSVVDELLQEAREQGITSPQQPSPRAPVQLAVTKPIRRQPKAQTRAKAKGGAKP